MKNNYPIDKLSYNIKRIVYCKNYCLLYCDIGNFILKKKSNYEEKIIITLDSIGFNNYLKDYIEIDNYKLLSIGNRVLNTNNINNKDIIYTLSILHNKSFVVNRRILDSYYNANDILSYELLRYYLNIHDQIDEMEVVMPEYYLLLLNISKIYKLINIGREYLKKWYETSNMEVKTSYVMRNNSFDNCIYENNNLCFLDFSFCKRDIYIVDLACFYLKYYDDSFISSYIELYKNNVDINNSDLFLLYYLISRPFKISFSNNHQINISLVKDLIKYVDYTLNFILKENEKYQKTDE